MNFLDLVKKRQSTRNFLPGKKIPRETIERCLEAARLAPSADNAQPWSFIVINNEILKNKLTESAFSGIYFISSFAKKASVIIAVIREHSNLLTRVGGQIRKLEYNLIDIGIACEHLILQATEEGLGSCWIGWFNEKGVKKVLNLPKEKKVEILIALGYPVSTEIRKKNRKPLSEIARFR